MSDALAFLALMIVYLSVTETLNWQSLSFGSHITISALIWQEKGVKGIWVPHWWCTWRLTGWLRRWPWSGHPGDCGHPVQSSLVGQCTLILKFNQGLLNDLLFLRRRLSAASTIFPDK